MGTKAAMIAGCLIIVCIGCAPAPAQRLWNCSCAVEAHGSNGNITVPMWCDDGHDQYDNGAMMQSYCWSWMSIWWDPDEFSCDCICESIEATTEECTGVDHG
jgi:hypothetical protein